MIKALFLFVSVSILSFGAEPLWLTSLEEAKTLAKKENKDLILMLTKEECDACWYMKNIVFEDADVKHLIENSFIGVILDVDVEEIPVEFHYIGTPTFYFMDAHGRKFGYRLDGASNIKDFRQKISTVLDKKKN